MQTVLYCTVYSVRYVEHLVLMPVTVAYRWKTGRNDRLNILKQIAVSRHRIESKTKQRDTETNKMCQSTIPMIILLCLLYCGLSDAGSMDELSKANNAFAVDLYKKIGDANIGKNLFFSPISISTAFGMVNLGANGRTKNQTNAVLHLNKIRSEETMKKAYKKLFTTFKRQNSSYTLHLVNRLFGSNDFDFHHKFLQDVKNYFRASLESLDFKNKPEKSLRHINDWVEKQTNQLIKDLLPIGTINNYTVMIIVNAIYFKASWFEPFRKRLTRPGNFSISKSQTYDMHMMHLYEEYFNYHNSSELSCQVLELPYQENKASMFVFLPHDIEGLPNLEKQLTGKLLADTLRNVESRIMMVQFPKFLIKQDVSLKEILETMGMADIFNPRVSDLSGIGGPDRLFVSDAFHKAFINVSENGTEAAAATGSRFKLNIGPRHPMILFIVDRPFLFLIYDKITKSVLFMGRLVRPPTAN